MADDGIKLTDDEQEQVNAAIRGSRGYYESTVRTHAAVESIVAARVQALTAERDELKSDLSNEASALQEAEAELAAANARIAELEQAGTQSFVLGELVPDPLLTEHEAQVTDALRSRLAKSEATNVALSARLERVRALADECAEAIEPDGSQSIAPVHWFADMLRAALGEDA